MNPDRRVVLRLHGHEYRSRTGLAIDILDGVGEGVDAVEILLRLVFDEIAVDGYRAVGTRNRITERIDHRRRRRFAEATDAGGNDDRGLVTQEVVGEHVDRNQQIVLVHDDHVVQGYRDIVHFEDRKREDVSCR